MRKSTKCWQNRSKQREKLIANNKKVASSENWQPF